MKQKEQYYKKLHHSLSSKISGWVVLAAAVLLSIMMGYIWRVWSRAIRYEVDKDAMQVLDNTVMRVNGLFALQPPVRGRHPRRCRAGGGQHVLADRA